MHNRPSKQPGPSLLASIGLELGSPSPQGYFWVGPYQDEFSNIFPSNGKSIGKEGATRINNQVTASEAL